MKKKSFVITFMKRTSRQISDLMSRVKCKGSKIEKILALHLRKNSVKFRRYYKIFGKPDFVVANHKIAVFCDSHFWHGYNWRKRKKDFKTNKIFWLNKITANMKRDKKVNRVLKKNGWKIVRFWEHQIIKNPEICIRKIKDLYAN